MGLPGPAFAAVLVALCFGSHVDALAVPTGGNEQSLTTPVAPAAIALLPPTPTTAEQVKPEAKLEAKAADVVAAAAQATTNPAQPELVKSAALELTKTDAPETFPVVSAAHAKMLTLPSGASLECFVVSLPSQPDRLQSFLAAWHSAWPAMQPATVDGVMHSTRGRGILTAYTNAVKSLIARYNSNPSKAPDFVVFFEDDARPFHDVKWPHDLEVLLSKTPLSASTLLLGGHHFGKLEEPHANDLGVTRISRAYGAYAWVARRSALQSLYDRWSQHLGEHLDMYSVDVVWWDVWKSRPGFVATPLLVDHPHGYSNTWKKVRNDAWAGHRDWWNMEPAPTAASLLQAGIQIDLANSLPPDF